MHYLEVLNISENIFRKFAEYCLALKKSVATPLLLAGGTCSRYGLSIMKRAEKPLRAHTTCLAPSSAHASSGKFPSVEVYFTSVLPLCLCS